MTAPRPSTRDPLPLRRTALLLALVVPIAAAQEVRQAPLPSGHPLLGTWRIEFTNGCFEEYTLRPDGTKGSVSGKERNESVFELSEQPSAKGLYRWVDKIIKGNGQPDCSGSVTKVGHVAVNFVRLHPGGAKFLLCESEVIGTCFAEFNRVGQGA